MAEKLIVRSAISAPAGRIGSSVPVLLLARRGNAFRGST